MPRAAVVLALLVAGSGAAHSVRGEPERPAAASAPARATAPTRSPEASPQASPEGLPGTVEPAAEPASPGSGDAGPGAEERAAPRSTIPFRHRVGDRWRLVIERRAVEDGLEGPAEVLAHEAHVVSPLRRDFLVELLALERRTDDARELLQPRGPRNAASLDRLGGGRLALRVDRTGTAVGLENRDEVRRALERAHGAALPPPQAEALLADLLAGWNAAYRACGVPLVPGREVHTEIPALGAQGQDRRILAEEPDALTLSALTVWREDRAPGTLLREHLCARFDLATGLLSGSHLEERSDGARRAGRRLAFREEPLARGAGSASR